MARYRGYRQATRCPLPPRYVLLIAEKPKAGYMIATALSGGRARKCYYKGVPFWVFNIDGQGVVVAPAAGHLYGLCAKEDGYPVFEYEWRPLWLIERGSDHLERFFSMLSYVARRASVFVNACDYDIEGSVIGYLLIRALGDLRRARRMKFSSLAASELRRAFANLLPLDIEMVEAGLCRHELDWMWGINVSRALMDAYKRATGTLAILSAGRVQTPTLVKVYEREMERRLFVPLPRYVVTVTVEYEGKVYAPEPIKATFDTKEEAMKAAAALRAIGYLRVLSATERQVELRPPPPFNLGDLQQEAYRLYKLSPLRTQKLAEELYLDALISYPRTNSQKLPGTLDVRSVLSGLARNPAYGEAVRELLRETGGAPIPHEGPKDDPAHPAIHPTGRLPKDLSDEHRKVYDLVVRRFLASMAPPAKVVVRSYALVGAAGMKYRLLGKKLRYPGWLKYYPYLRPEEAEAPELSLGERLPLRSVRVRVVYTRPPPPDTKASIVRWMEAVNIGTEGTRARILETLFKRGYLELRKGRVTITDLGLAVSEVLLEHFGKLTSVELTREFERAMDAIRLGGKRREEVVEEAKRLLRELLSRFKPVSAQAGLKLAKAVGKVEPARRCKLCWREGSIENYCKYHSMALSTLKAIYAEWRRRTGQGFYEYLTSVSKLSFSGMWVREVAKHLLEVMHEPQTRDHQSGERRRGF